MGTMSGMRSSQTGIFLGHLGAKGQPGGRLSSEGAYPLMGISRVPLSSARAGMLPSSASV